MNKMYLVREVHDYDRFFTIGVCPNRELAETLQQKNKNLWDLEDCEITSEMWDTMVEKYYTSGNYDSGKTLAEAMIELFPEYPVSDIEAACGEYEHRSYIGTVIEEITLYANDSDIVLYGINS